MALWHTGIMHSMDDAVLSEPENYGIDFESSVIEMDDNCNVVLPESRVQMVIENAKRYGWNYRLLTENNGCYSSARGSPQETP